MYNSSFLTFIKLKQVIFPRENYLELIRVFPLVYLYTHTLFQVLFNQVFSADFLAHLSRRLIGELIGYSWSGVNPSVIRPSSVRPSVVHPQCSKIFSKTALPIKPRFYVEPHWVGGNKSLFVASGSHDQDGRHAHIW